MMEDDQEQSDVPGHRQINRRRALALAAMAAPAAAAQRRDDRPGPAEMLANLAAATVARLDPEAVMVLLAGHSLPGDRGGGRYVRVNERPGHAAAFRAADGGWFTIDEPLVSPLHFGARGDGTGDDGAAFQALIDAVFGGPLRGRPHFPAGFYRISRMIRLPTGPLGCTIEGDGAMVAPPRLRHGIDNSTALVWDGVAGGTMIGGKGNMCYGLRDMALVGSMDAKAPRAGILYHCDQDRTNSNGSGVGLMEQVAFFDAAVAIRMGSAVDDGNCADWTFVRVSFGWCDIGLHVVDRQGLNYNLIGCSGLFCRSMVRMDAGGHFYATNLQITRCGGIGDDKWTLDFRELGDNAAIVSIDGLRIELDTKQALRAVGGIVMLRGYEEAQAAQSCTMVDVSGGTLIVEGARLVSRSRESPHFRLSAGPGASRPKLYLRNVHFDVPQFCLDEWIRRDPGSNAIISLSGCTYGNAANPLPIAAVCNLLSEGRVALSGRTEGAAPALLSIDGAPTGDAGDAARLPDGCDALVTASIVGLPLGSADPIVIERRALVLGTGTRGVHSLEEGAAAAVGRRAAIVAVGDAVSVRVEGVANRTIAWAATLDAVILPASR